MGCSGVSASALRRAVEQVRFYCWFCQIYLREIALFLCSYIVWRNSTDAKDASASVLRPAVEQVFFIHFFFLNRITIHQM